MFLDVDPGFLSPPGPLDMGGCVLGEPRAENVLGPCAPSTQEESWAGRSSMFHCHGWVPGVRDCGLAESGLSANHFWVTTLNHDIPQCKVGEKPPL